MKPQLQLNKYYYYYYSQDTDRNTQTSKSNVCPLQPEGIEESLIGSEVARNVIGHCLGLGDVGGYRHIANVRALFRHCRRKSFEPVEVCA